VHRNDDEVDQAPKVDHRATATKPRGIGRVIVGPRRASVTKSVKNNPT